MSRFLPGNTEWKRATTRGRRPLPPELTTVLMYHEEHIGRLMCQMLDWTQDEFEAVMKNSLSPMLVKLVGAVMMKGIMKGEPIYLEFILNRVIGKPKEREQESDSGELVEMLKEVPKENIVAFLKSKRPTTNG